MATHAQKRHRPPPEASDAHEILEDSIFDADRRDETTLSLAPPAKRRRVYRTQADAHTESHDLLSALSDELLIRILSFLPLQYLLAVAPVSRRFYHLAADSQLWKALYYDRFVLPRAMRIPGFRDGGGGGAGHKLHYSGRRTLWADGRRGGIVRDDHDRTRREQKRVRDESERGDADDDVLVDPLAPKTERNHEPVNWKRQFKIRHNWSRGKCAVEELRIGTETEAHDEGKGRMLAKVVEGIAVTADQAGGLRAWGLRDKRLLAQADVGGATPSCMAVDDAEFDHGILDVAVGFDDGSFGVWRLWTKEERLVQRYWHGKSSNGELIAMGFSHPYLLTATTSVLISLYTFEVPSTKGRGREEPTAAEATTHLDSRHIHAETRATADRPTDKPPSTDAERPAAGEEKDALPPPYLLTSLDSHSSRPPLALSIRRTTTTTIASIAYTFSTRQGWSIGVQDLHIRPPAPGSGAAPEIAATRIAYTTPFDAGPVTHAPQTPPTPRRRHQLHQQQSQDPDSSPTTPGGIALSEPGPTTLCYTHPYLLATLPDNTLVLHMCTSNASTLSLSRGIRLWGHTSGVSDAEITARGKAVSVSSRGEEMRVWELEGRLAGSSTSAGMGNRSVEIRPGQSPGRGVAQAHADPVADWDERRNWVGFDDEMVIVLKETKGGRESLLVYDFT